jgi:hypothetical protein
MTPTQLNSSSVTIDAILALCGEMPDAAKHRHYLEQLPARQLAQRLEDLRASEKKHADRWYGGRDIEQPTFSRARMGMVATS